jgi:hypothetical protein
MEIARSDGAAKSGRSVCGIHESPPSSHSTDAIVRHPPKPWPPRFRIPCAGFTRAERTRRPKDRLKRVRTGKHKPTSSSAPRAVMGSPPGAPRTAAAESGRIPRCCSANQTRSLRVTDS